jgi:hypothetical protein
MIELRLTRLDSGTIIYIRKARFSAENRSRLLSVDENRTAPGRGLLYVLQRHKVIHHYSTCARWRVEAQNYNNITASSWTGMRTTRGTRQYCEELKCDGMSVSPLKYNRTVVPVVRTAARDDSGRADLALYYVRSRIRFSAYWANKSKPFRFHVESVESPSLRGDRVMRHSPALHRPCR